MTSNSECSLHAEGHLPTWRVSPVPAGCLGHAHVHFASAVLCRILLGWRDFSERYPQLNPERCLVIDHEGAGLRMASCVEKVVNTAVMVAEEA